jgi:ABC-type multidrug transport system fused ATPase/permease subunit
VSAAPYRQTFGRLLRFLGPYRWSLVVSIVLAVLSQAAAIGIVVLTSVAIDGIEAQRGTRFLAWIVVAILAVGVA